MAYSTTTTILGPSRGTADTFYELLAERKGDNAPKRLDQLKSYLETVYAIAPKIGIRAELVVMQSWLETGAWTSNWWNERLNPAGIGITGDPAQNNASRSFADGVAAARAQLVQLWLYAKGEQLPANSDLKSSESPRWQAALSAGRAGIAKTLNDLGGATGWATDVDYGTKLAKLLNEVEGLLGTSTAPGTQLQARDIEYLEEAEDTSIVYRRANRDGTLTTFFRIGREIRAVHETPLLSAAAPKASVLEVVAAGTLSTADWGWVEPDGSLYYYNSASNARMRGADWVSTSEPIVIPDPDPGVQPSAPKPGEEITAANYKLVEDPTVLLPAIIWKGTTNFYSRRNGYGNPIAMVHHVTDDLKLSSTISWFQTNGSNASSHFVIDRDGTVYQFVSSVDGAWTNGDVQSPRTDIPWLNDALTRGINPNNATITIEYVATPSVPPTDAQYEAGIALCRYFAHPSVYGIDPDRGHQLRHADINSVSRSYCPGPNFDLERIIEALGGDPASMD